jgi:acyl carrier protein
MPDFPNEERCRLSSQDKRVEKLLAEVLGVAVEEIHNDSDQYNLPGWSSRRHIELMVRLEEEFGVQIRSSEMHKLTSLAEIRARVQ